MLQYQPPFWWFFLEFDSGVHIIFYTGRSKTGCSILDVVSQVMGGMKLPQICLLCPCSFHTNDNWPSLLSGHCWLMLSLLSVKTPGCFTAQRPPSQALPSPYCFQDFLFLRRRICIYPWGTL